ncbi:J domain-containing protein [Desulfonatronovibrio hydrogenovorans]|uniref:J domain-containing protein n=1 Tax=Desulfonatronovibrio hydrogenovorans TaxID=53245 RepID=UPI00048E6EB5|nr:J domain-containing protein [Desulfonatronovibrio hydrogenovorans]
MYLAQKVISGERHYFIRESVHRDGVYVSRELMSLGTDPSGYLVYPGGRSFYIHEQVEECLARSGADPDYDELEELFWPFVRPDIRHSIQGFRSRGRKRFSELTRQEEDFIANHLHPVDRRRYNYLRTGELDQSKQAAISYKFYRSLAFKSRDELEHRFMDMEKELEPDEFSLYVYSFLYLRRHFSEIIAGKMPQGLDPEKLDRLFLEELCGLNRDDLFWKGAGKPEDLHPYLLRYVIMFFDHPLGSESFMQDHLRDFFARTRRRFGDFPVKKPDLSPDEAGRIMGISSAILSSMSQRELTRIYRGLAMKMHPDRGGDHDQFIRLTQAYKMLLSKKTTGGI